MRQREYTYCLHKLTLSVIIPVLDGADYLRDCLNALKLSQGREHILEVIVVDDCSSDGSPAVAEAAGATVLRTPGTMGPAAARNLGAAYASGDLLVFIDSDVCVHPGALARMRERFENEPDLDALIGSYDDEPADAGFVSQYKNLMQHYVHQNGRREATTFWSGCGAVRREVFLSVGGFDETYKRPSIEDIDLGYRLLKRGHRIALDPAVLAKHMKRWSLASLVCSDIFDRALPWSRLILRSARLPNDLNVAVCQRWSAALVVAAVGLAGASAVFASIPALPAVFLLGAAMLLNFRFYRFLAAKRGWMFAARAVPLHLAYYLYSALTFAAAAAAHPFSRRRPDHSAELVSGASASEAERFTVSLGPEHQTYAARRSRFSLRSNSSSEISPRA